ncbi:hypothetical protein ACFRCI_02685 [Streptomyces sp. NPDC056638]|uniref:hypothetical protein n=1 Tax=Streptomyces sp. NPDC056638 TaxID=3345887 RepID=UPI00367B37F4
MSAVGPRTKPLLLAEALTRFAVPLRKSTAARCPAQVARPQGPDGHPRTSRPVRLLVAHRNNADFLASGPRRAAEEALHPHELK